MTIVESHSIALGHLQAGRLAEAERAYRDILRQDPRNVEALLNLGILAASVGHFQPALDLMNRANALRPDFPPILMNLAQVYGRAGQAPLAIAAYRRVTEIQPGFGNALECLGDLLLKEKKPAEAATYLQRAVLQNPGNALAHNLLGVALSSQGLYAAAVASFDRALRIDPRAPEPHYNRAVALDHLGRADDAFEGLDRAIDLFPDLLAKLKCALFAPEIMPSLPIIERTRQRVRSHLARLLHGEFTLPGPERLDAMLFLLAYHGENDRELQAMLTRLLLRAHPGLAETAPHCAQPRQPRGAGVRIKVGFCSKYLRSHTIGRLNAGLMRQLNRQLFEVVLLRCPGKDKEIEPTPEFIRQGADSTVVLAADLPSARRQIADLRLDVLYYPEIGMDVFTYLLAFARLAPVQCVGWGHPDTTGIPNLDYFLSSVALEPEGAEEHYTEKLVKLPSLTNYYVRPQLDLPALTRADFGLSAGLTLYVCPQSLFKIHPEFDAILGGILRADPRGRIVFTEGAEPHWTALLTERFQRNLPDVAKRILFVGRQTPNRFLHLLANCDVMLDPIHFGGGNTSYEGFAVGIPIVTMPGRFLRSRLTYAMYRQMDIDDCVAESADDYVRRAVRLGVEGGYGQLIRDEILSRNDALYENAGAVRELERFFLDAVAKARG
jgi:protein O-GlcNAc transferase